MNILTSLYFLSEHCIHWDQLEPQSTREPTDVHNWGQPYGAGDKAEKAHLWIESNKGKIHYIAGETSTW